MWLLPLGMPFLVVLGCSRFCLEMLLICLTVGGPMVGLGVLQCGKWCICDSFGVWKERND